MHGPCREAFGFFWFWWVRDAQAPVASLEVLLPMLAVGSILEVSDVGWCNLESQVEGAGQLAEELNESVFSAQPSSPGFIDLANCAPVSGHVGFP
jgi:hypothetical protein